MKTATNPSISKLLTVESDVGKLSKQVEKLINLSAQHGTRIKELYQSTANNVSQVEFMAAIATTRYQHTNDLNRLKNGNKESDPNSNESGDGDDRESKELRTLKEQVSSLEKDIFGYNFKYNLEVKKLETALARSKKDNIEMKKYTSELEKKLSYLVDDLHDCGIFTNVAFDSDQHETKPKSASETDRSSPRTPERVIPPSAMSNLQWEEDSKEHSEDHSEEGSLTDTPNGSRQNVTELKPRSRSDRKNIVKPNNNNKNENNMEIYKFNDLDNSDWSAEQKRVDILDILGPRKSFFPENVSNGRKQGSGRNNRVDNENYRKLSEKDESYYQKQFHALQSFIIKSLYPWMEEQRVNNQGDNEGLIDLRHRNKNYFQQVETMKNVQNLAKQISSDGVNNFINSLENAAYEKFKTKIQKEYLHDKSDSEGFIVQKGEEKMEFNQEIQGPDQSKPPLFSSLTSDPSQLRNIEIPDIEEEIDVREIDMDSEDSESENNPDSSLITQQVIENPQIPVQNPVAIISQPRVEVKVKEIVTEKIPRAETPEELKRFNLNPNENKSFLQRASNSGGGFGVINRKSVNRRASSAGKKRPHSSGNEIDYAEFKALLKANSPKTENNKTHFIPAPLMYNDSALSLTTDGLNLSNQPSDSNISVESELSSPRPLKPQKNVFSPNLPAISGSTDSKTPERISKQPFVSVPNSALGDILEIGCTRTEITSPNSNQQSVQLDAPGMVHVMNEKLLEFYSAINQEVKIVEDKYTLREEEIKIFMTTVTNYQNSLCQVKEDQRKIHCQQLEVKDQMRKEQLKTQSALDVMHLSLQQNKDKFSELEDFLVSVTDKIEKLLNNQNEKTREIAEPKSENTKKPNLSIEQILTDTLHKPEEKPTETPVKNVPNPFQTEEEIFPFISGCNFVPPPELLPPILANSKTSERAAIMLQTYAESESEHLIRQLKYYSELYKEMITTLQDLIPKDNSNFIPHDKKKHQKEVNRVNRQLVINKEKKPILDTFEDQELRVKQYQQQQQIHSFIENMSVEITRLKSEIILLKSMVQLKPNQNPVVKPRNSPEPSKSRKEGRPVSMSVSKEGSLEERVPSHIEFSKANLENERKMKNKVKIPSERESFQVLNQIDRNEISLQSPPTTEFKNRFIGINHQKPTHYQIAKKHQNKENENSLLVISSLTKPKEKEILEFSIEENEDKQEIDKLMETKDSDNLKDSSTNLTPMPPGMISPNFRRSESNSTFNSGISRHQRLEKSNSGKNIKNNNMIHTDTNLEKSSFSPNSSFSEEKPTNSHIRKVIFPQVGEESVEARVSWYREFENENSVDGTQSQTEIDEIEI